MNYCYDRIPDEMHQMKRWIAWRAIRKNDGRVAKVPFSVLSHKADDWNTPNAWTTFKEALGKINQYDGIGFVLQRESGIVAIDFDDCVVNGHVHPYVEEILTRMKDTYIELSQSKQGVHVFAYGSIPKNINNRDRKIEMYIENRYIAMTGLPVPGIQSKTCLANQSEFLTDLYKMLSKPRQRCAEKNAKSFFVGKSLKKELISSIEDVLNIMLRTSPTASAYFNGTRSCGDHSRDDFAFLLILRSFTNADPDMMKELFLRSKLSRLNRQDKRNSPEKYLEYLERSIENAIKFPGYRPFKYPSKGR